MEGPVRSLPWDRIAARVGEDFGASAWRTITQPMVDAFADATDDHYFLHVDPARAAVPPFAGTIAHGFFTLSLLAPMAYEVCPYVEGARYPLNYGFDRVRFVSPVPVGSRIRGRFVLRAAEVIGAAQRQTAYEATVEIEGAARPALVAYWLGRFVM
jgi:acyl dehydratase